MAEFRTPFGIRRQLRLLVPVLTTWAAASMVLAGAGTQRWASLDDLFLDASYLGGQPWFSGILNEAGLISWAVAATAAGLGSWVATISGRRGAARFLGVGCLVVTALLTDIWIQFHSAVAPGLGLPSNVAQLLIALAALSWPLLFWRETIRTRWLILVCSYGFLGVSAGIDTVWEPSAAAGLWLEDGARLIGILGFTHYIVVTTVDIIRSLHQPRDLPRDQHERAARDHAEDHVG